MATHDLRKILFGKPTSRLGSQDRILAQLVILALACETTPDELSRCVPWLTRGEDVCEMPKTVRKAIAKALNVPAGLIDKVIDPGSAVDNEVSCIASSLSDILSYQEDIAEALEVWRTGHGY